MALSDGAEIESAARLLDAEAVDVEVPASGPSGRRAKAVAVSIAMMLGVVGWGGFAQRRHASGLHGGDFVKLSADAGKQPEPVEPYAKVPLQWTVITKKDGTGRYPEEKVNEMIEALNKHFSGNGNGLPESPDVEAVLSGDDCNKKCNIALCYKGGSATDLETKLRIDNECYCGADYCTHWGWKYADEKPSALDGPNLDTGISFHLNEVKYVENDEWHLQCCCTHAGFKYEIKQQEIYDQAIDKDTVRKVTNIIVCDMTTLGGGTAGQSMITGSSGCSGGPGIMLDFSSIVDVKYGVHTLAHEFGHNLGLFHTFNEECNGNFGCAKEDACNPELNVGDKISDTPLHLKQEACNGADSCPDAPGKDPLDNYMSYSGCDQRRFTAEQVKKMQDTVAKYFPTMLVGDHGEPEDLPCNPEFPDGTVPDGYAPPQDEEDGGGGGGHSPPSCQLEVGQCDQHDTTGCYCADSRMCCAGHGCGGSAGSLQCLPCSWKPFDGIEWTADACQTPNEQHGL